MGQVDRRRSPRVDFRAAVEVQVIGKADCGTCRAVKEEHFGPSHNGSLRCESGSIASGGTRAHCTCSTCF